MGSIPKNQKIPPIIIHIDQQFQKKPEHKNLIAVYIAINKNFISVLFNKRVFIDQYNNYNKLKHNFLKAIKEITFMDLIQSYSIFISLNVLVFKKIFTDWYYKKFESPFIHDLEIKKDGFDDIFYPILYENITEISLNQKWLEYLDIKFKPYYKYDKYNCHNSECQNIFDRIKMKFSI